MEIVWFILIGIASGWLASRLAHLDTKKGLIGNLILGVIGAVVGGFVFSLAGIAAGGLLGRLIVATVGAVILIYLARTLRLIR